MQLPALSQKQPPNPVPTALELLSFGKNARLRQNNPEYKAWIEALRQAKLKAREAGLVQILDSSDPVNAQNAKDLWKLAIFALQTGVFSINWRMPGALPNFATVPNEVELEAHQLKAGKPALSKMGIRRSLFKFLFDNHYITPSKYADPKTGGLLYQLDMRFFLNFDWRLNFAAAPAPALPPQSRKLRFFHDAEEVTRKKSGGAKGPHAEICSPLPGATIDPAYLEMLAVTQPGLLARPHATVDLDDNGRPRVTPSDPDSSGANVILIEDLMARRTKPQPADRPEA